MTVRARIPLLLAAILALGLCTGSSCHDEPTSGGRTTTITGRASEARTLEGGCPAGEPTMRLDLNRDGNLDYAVYPEDDGTCRAGDLNFDGTDDIYRHFDGAGNLVREEADGDLDRRLDSVAIYHGTATDPMREEFDTNWDGRIDIWVDFSRDCAFGRSGAHTCTTECAASWCAPRLPEPDPEFDIGPPAEGPPPATAVLYRDSNGDGIWDTAEVLHGEHPICVAFNTNRAGDDAATVHPEVVEVYRPAAASLGRPDIDYLRRDYLDLDGNPIVRCEDSDGQIVDCPSRCGG